MGTSLAHRKDRDSLIEAVMRSLTLEQTRSLLASAIEEMVGTNSVNDAIRKLCVLNEVPLLRLLTILVYGADPLYGRTEVVRRCHFVELPATMELHFETDSGSLCIGLSKSATRVASSCRGGMVAPAAEERRAGGVEVRLSTG